MQEQIIQHSEDTVAAVGAVRTDLGEATALTLGDNTGSSEDKRYIYN